MKDQKKAGTSGNNPLLIGIVVLGVICALAIGIVAGQYLAGSKSASPKAGGAEVGLSAAAMETLKTGIVEAQDKKIKEMMGQVQEMVGERRLMDIGTLPVAILDLSATGVMGSKGPENAPVTLVEFSDFQCPYCARMAQALEELTKKYSGSIRLIFVDRPLITERDGYPFHPYTYIAHEAAASAQAQGKFWEMYNYIFQHQSEIFPQGRPTSAEDYAAKQQEFRDKLVKVAGELGLDAAKMKADLDGHTYKARLDRTIALADSMQINSTPTIYMNAFFTLRDPNMLGNLLGSVKKIE